MRVGRRLAPAAAGLAAGCAALALWTLAPERAADALSTPAVDALYRLAPAPPDPRVVVVDIDRDSLARIGPWPWPRDRLAALVEAVAAARPAVLALDVLIAEPDRRAPRALARALAETTGRDDVARLAAELPDPDRRLAEALGAAPAVVGFLAAPEAGPAPAGPPVAVGRDVRLDRVWAAPGAEGPLAELADAAAGVGLLSLVGDDDGAVRSVPMLVVAGGRAFSGLAGEAVRVAEGASTHLVRGDPATMTIGGHRVALGADGAAILRPSAPERRAETTLPAAALLDPADPVGRSAAARLAGRIVFIGSSAPELGGLRPTAVDPLTPSVRIHADAAAAILADRVPVRPALGDWIERAAAAAMAAAAVLAALRTGPLAGGAAAAAIALAWAAGAALATLAHDTVLDPATPPAVALVAFATAAFAGHAETRRREAALRRRFEQHLAPDLVRRLAENPDLVRVEGELRPVTALFTDIEGFTAMTERAEPRALVALLDRYFEGVVGIVVAHGGMVDKIVGDAVHALFNVPLDQPDHAVRALACARAVADFAAAFRQGADARALGLGRTRIGLETGPAIVGDVGGGRKLDFTAHGSAVNAAARLEAANKLFGSTVAAGPGLVAAVPQARWRPLGRIALRGLSAASPVAEPWPDATSDATVAAYAAAYGLLGRDPAAARAAFAALAAAHPDDPVLARWPGRIDQGDAVV